MGRARPAAALLAAGLAVATRLPGEPLAVAVAASAAAAFAGGALAAALRPGRRVAPAVMVAAGVTLLAVPASPSPTLAVPAVATAFAVLAALHLNLQAGTGASPAAGRRAASFVRRVPVLALCAGLAAVVAARSILLPDRVASLQEWQGAAGPLAAAGLVVLALVASASMRALSARRAPDAGTGAGAEDAAVAEAS